MYHPLCTIFSDIDFIYTYITLSVHPHDNALFVYVLHILNVIYVMHRFLFKIMYLLFYSLYQWHTVIFFICIKK